MFSKFAKICLMTLLVANWAVAQNPPHSVELEARSGGTFYVDAVLVDSVPVKLLLDTGASMLTVNKTTFRQLRDQTDLFYSHDLGFRNANGKINKVKVYILPRLTLGDGCQLEDVEVAVMSGGSNILGMNVLTQFAPLGLSVQPPRLELSNCSDGLIANHAASDQ